MTQKESSNSPEWRPIKFSKWISSNLRVADMTFHAPNKKTIKLDGTTHPPAVFFRYGPWFIFSTESHADVIATKDIHPFQKKRDLFATWWWADMRKLGRFFSKRQEFQDFQVFDPRNVRLHKSETPKGSFTMVSICFHVKFGSMLNFRGGVFSVHVLKL